MLVVGLLAGDVVEIAGIAGGGIAAADDLCHPHLIYLHRRLHIILLFHDAYYLITTLNFVRARSRSEM